MRLHNKEHIVLMAPHRELCKELQMRGIQVLPSENLLELRDNERFHADMQLCIINDKAFIPKNCSTIGNELSKYGYDTIECCSLSRDYPENVSLNVALIGNKLFCKSSSLDNRIREYCLSEGIEIIDVNQGYTKCSTLILDNKAIITSDQTISEAAEKQGIEVLKITAGHIFLEGADYGFIGGCSGTINDTVYFFGDVTKHPDAHKIINFLVKHNMKHVNLLQDTLTDIGGFVLLV